MRCLGQLERDVLSDQLRCLACGDSRLKWKKMEETITRACQKAEEGRKKRIENNNNNNNRRHK